MNRSATSRAHSSSHDPLIQAIEDGVRYLREVQEPAGSWQGACEVDPSFTAMDVLARTYLGAITTRQVELAAAWLLTQEVPGGGWPIVPEGPADPIVTTAVCAALLVAGYTERDPCIRRAAELIGGLGRRQRVRDLPVTTLLAMNGFIPWKSVPNVPLGVVALIDSIPIQPRLFYGQARGVVFPMVALRRLRPCRDLGLRLPWMPRDHHHRRGLRPRPNRTGRGNRTLESIRGDILARIGSDGSVAGQWISTVFSCLVLAAMEDEHAPIVIASMGKYIAEDDVSRRLMPFASRGGSTAFAMLALELAGLQPDEVPMVAGRRWLVSNQCQRTDSIPVTEAPTGWAFEGNNDVYPDSDDTAIVLASLLQPGWRNDPPLARAVETGFAWLASQQHPSGGWAAFDRYPDWLCQAPGGRILDKVGLLELPSGGITARCLMAWAHLRGEDLDPVRRATTWLVRHQSPDGTWEDRWTPGYATSTGCVVLALAMTGLPEGAKAAARGAEWLRGAQNDDGGWGSRLPVTTFPRWPGVRRAGVLDEPLSKDVARSTVFETSMSLLALLSHTCSTEPAIERGIRYLLSMQDDQGSWSDDAPVIVYLADQWYNSYPLVSTATAMCAILTYERVSTGIQRSSRSFLPIGMLA